MKSFIIIALLCPLAFAQPRGVLRHPVYHPSRPAKYLPVQHQVRYNSLTGRWEAYKPAQGVVLMEAVPGWEPGDHIDENGPDWSYTPYTFYTSANPLSGQDGLVHVRSYHRKDGTYVPSHVRTQPDGFIPNNFSAYRHGRR